MWTYVKDSLPTIPIGERSVSCLVTIEPGIVVRSCYTNYWSIKAEFTDPERHYRVMDSEVIAWMYMPKPAKKKE